MKKERKLKAVEPVEEVPQEPVPELKFTVVQFDGQDFEIHPISDRDDDFAYEDSARFLTLAIPVGSKVLSEILKVGADNQAVSDRIAKAQAENEDQVSVIIDLVGLVSKLDVGSLLDEVSDTLPKLAAIACHYTDPDVTERDIKRWSKGPLNPMLWKTVIAQITADNVFQQVAGLTQLMGEFSKAA